MRNSLLLAGVLIGCLTVGAAATWKTTQTPPAAPLDRSENIQALKLRIDDFIAAYNKADAKTIAALFTPEAELVDDEENVTQGRENIEKAFAQYFKQNKNLRVEVNITARRFVSTDTVVEDGDAIIHYLDSQTVSRAKFMNVVVRREGKWLVASSRETADTGGAEITSPHSKLQALEWMLGEWVDEEGDLQVTASCRWSPDKNYILREFTCRKEGKEVSHGTQRIGWDGQAQQIKSWMFDSEGGHGEATWVQDGNRWLVKARGVSGDGTPGSATYVFTQQDPNTVILSVRDRVTGTTLEPDFEVRLVRKAPAPAK
jgi:uncharacterized protein (TIGR02246 family)